MDFRDWSLSDLFKAKDAFDILMELGYWFDPELNEVKEAIRSHPDNPDHERDIKEKL